MKELLGWSLDGALDPWSCFKPTLAKSTILPLGKPPSQCKSRRCLEMSRKERQGKDFSLDPLLLALKISLQINIK